MKWSARIVRDEGPAGDRAARVRRLSLGDAERAAELAGEQGTAFACGRRGGCARGDARGREATALRPWDELLRSVRTRGEADPSGARGRCRTRSSSSTRRGSANGSRPNGPSGSGARGGGETAALDLALQLVTLWFADLISPYSGR